MLYNGKMEFSLPSAIKILEKTPGMLRLWLLGLDMEWITNNYGQQTFSPFDVVGHLLHGEQTDWMARLELILDHGEGQTFTPWDRYAMYEESKGKTIEQLVDEFASARQGNLNRLRSKNLDPSDLGKFGRHPKFGRVSLSQLLATWVAHDLNHIHQIAKCMAWQYRDEIGPWREYVTFIDR